MRKIKKILIANRGEIAVRVIKTARQMGIQTVAIYSTADRNSPHVLQADEAVCVGAPPSNQSYLQGDKIIAFAKKLKADAIHPGYGFLSENAEFAQKVTDNALIFIGPSANSIRTMGDKLAAKESVGRHKIPIVPGIDKAVTDPEKAAKIATQIGFPILIKAAAGGGGKGMRIVKKKSELDTQMRRAISEATSAFGDGSVFLEKYIESPRHIEIQILADTHGNVVHLFERECSIQRRHQKVIEEAPSCILTPYIREKMGLAAINVAKSCNYTGAGTVEFLLDDKMNFYFLEMNTRLQVEHPVTEYVTGLDLIEEQIRIAEGNPLSFSQEDIEMKGHAVELRVYAENPMDDFAPSIGMLQIYRPPKGKNIRVDDGYSEGMEVPIYYDPMLAKLITYAETREEAISLMIKAIDDYQISGVKTTLDFGKYVCRHEAFRSGKFDTHFVATHYSSEILKTYYEKEAALAAQVALKLYLEEERTVKVGNEMSLPK